MLKFKIIQKENKPVLTLHDNKLMAIINSINELECCLSFIQENNSFKIDIEHMFINLEDCIDIDNPNVLLEDDLKHILVTLKYVEHKGFKTFELFSEK